MVFGQEVLGSRPFGAGGPPTGPVSVTDTLTSSGTSTTSILESITDSPEISATSTQTNLEYTADDLRTSETSSQTIADATSEAASNSATSSPTQVESVSESVTNTATSSQSMVEAAQHVDTQTTIATSTQAFAEAEFDLLDAARAPPTTSTQTIAEESVTRDTLDTSSTSTQSLVESILFDESPLQSIGSSTPSVFEAEASDLDSSQTSSPSVLPADADTENSSATSTQSLDESAIHVDDQTTSAESTQTIDEAVGIPERFDSSHTSTQSASESVSESGVTDATSTQSVAEESTTLDTLDVSATSSQSMAEDIDVAEAPLQSIATSSQSIDEIVTLDTLESIKNDATLTSDIDELINADDILYTEADNAPAIDEAFAVAEQPMQSIATGEQTIDEDVASAIKQETLTSTSSGAPSIAEVSTTVETLTSVQGSFQSVISPEDPEPVPEGPESPTFVYYGPPPVKKFSVEEAIADNFVHVSTMDEFVVSADTLVTARDSVHSLVEHSERVITKIVRVPETGKVLASPIPADVLLDDSGTVDVAAAIQRTNEEWEAVLQGLYLLLRE